MKIEYNVLKTMTHTLETAFGTQTELYEEQIALIAFIAAMTPTEKS